MILLFIFTQDNKTIIGLKKVYKKSDVFLYKKLEGFEGK